MVSTQSLLYADPSAFTIDRVRTLVQQVGPEAPTVEYKEKMGPSVARGVAALGNTYGGLLLIGVTDSKREIKGVNEKTIEAVAEHCAAKIEPPWVPEIIPVRLEPESDRYVLVLRVIPGEHPRPLLVDGVAYVRHQNTTHAADWLRLKELFAETTAAPESAWNLHAPDIPQTAQGGADASVDFVIRTGLSFPVSTRALWRPLSERSVTAFTDALNQSRLNNVLVGLCIGDARAGGSNPFHREGFNRSRHVQLRWWGAPDGWPRAVAGPVDAEARLEIPGGYGQHGQHLKVEVDVVARLSDVHEVLARGLRPDSPTRRRIRIEELARLVDAMLEALVSQSVVGAMADLAGIDPPAVPQPRILHIVMGRPVTEVLDTAALRPIPNAGPSRGTHALADPTLDLADADDRWTQVCLWIEQAAQDAGLMRAEYILNNLTPPHRGT